MEKSVLFCFLLKFVLAHDSYISHNPLVSCDEEYIPDNCGYPNIVLENMITGEDFERCAPAVLSIAARNFYWSAVGRKRTYENNFEGLRKAKIIPRVLRDVTQNHLHTTLLGAKITMPLGIAPTANLKLAHPDGAIALAKAAASVGAVMVLSSSSQYPIEDVAKAAYSVNKNAVLWMQTYIMKNREEVLYIIERAAKSGFKAIVVTVDGTISTTTSCNGRKIYEDMRFPNLFNHTFPKSKFDASLTFKDLEWLVKSTKLPVVAKGILSADDAKRAAATGVSAILVSNHGARQMDSAPATIDVLPEIVMALKLKYPNVEVYMDGGIRNGWDVFKVLASGARAAFVGRLPIWGLAIGGEEGARKTLTILRTEFNESMIAAGYASPKQIYEEHFPLMTSAELECKLQRTCMHCCKSCDL